MTFKHDEESDVNGHGFHVFAHFHQCRCSIALKKIEHLVQWSTQRQLAERLVLQALLIQKLLVHQLTELVKY